MSELCNTSLHNCLGVSTSALAAPPILRAAFPRSPAEFVFRGRTLPGTRKLSPRRAKFSACDFNDLRRS